MYLPISFRNYQTNELLTFIIFLSNLLLYPLLILHFYFQASQLLTFDEKLDNDTDQFSLYDKHLQKLKNFLTLFIIYVFDVRLCEFLINTFS